MIHWIVGSALHHNSTCGRFSINRANPVGDNEQPGYLAWAVGVCGSLDGAYPWCVIGCYPTMTRARKACETYAKEVFRDA